MGIYTDYGRFMKARQFKEWCNSGAGIWFGFGLGSPEWDNIITDDGRGRPNVPPSSPNLYSPLYRWFTSYKEEHGATPPATLAPQELSLIDRSYWGTTDGEWPDDSTVISNPNLPPSQSSPSLGFYKTPTDSNPSFFNYENRESNDFTLLFPQVPVFPQSYEDDWSGIGKPIDVYNSTSNFDPDVEPTDPSQYKDFAYNYHLYYSDYNYSGSNFFGAPLGFMSFIQGSAQFVEPLEDDSSTESIDNIRKFKYGNHYWKIVPDSDIESLMGENPLPHHILLTVSVFPNELAKSSLVELQLPVRQVSVFKFPDELVTPLGLDVSPLPRSNQVIMRESLNMIYHKLESDHSITKSDNYSDHKNIPFHGFLPMDPNNTNTPTIEMLINDFMTARKRDVQQTDRYGYIIGF